MIISKNLTNVNFMKMRGFLNRDKKNTRLVVLNADAAAGYSFIVKIYTMIRRGCFNDTDASLTTYNVKKGYHHGNDKAAH